MGGFYMQYLESGADCKTPMEFDGEKGAIRTPVLWRLEEKYRDALISALSLSLALFSPRRVPRLYLQLGAFPRPPYIGSLSMCLRDPVGRSSTGTLGWDAGFLGVDVRDFGTSCRTVMPHSAGSYAGLCRRRGWQDPTYECYRDSSGFTCLVLVNGREYQTDLAYESDALAQENAAMRAFMVCRNFSVNGGMLARNGIVQGLPAENTRRTTKTLHASSGHRDAHRPGNHSSSSSTASFE
ncbi:hypothetical protein SODALDRAFT_325930 [Sodiomyces alkalinus F11]|uniref:DRBM domain-containing protein n=1 Tax=Sodiomyces alkalinus (strain CBS 110278 / VKM F-3762 / F11) TaxID=1314773 RepID=A0A3N2PQI3_SODAK|nr:hypothetical protein SODALDRAFT_325930 [Sodiomyces alkalinus F11]ROT36626.1 hypothetical protein SODALDRAFT_325930 [Sodiomyces alkalinus F11]